MVCIRRAAAVAMVLMTAASVSSCQWRGLNSFALPGGHGHGQGSFEVKAELPDVTNLERNSRVRVGDVVVGTVTDVQVVGWHALVTMRLDDTVHLPANATAKIGQTSLLGSLHVELAPPATAPAQGALSNGSVIPLASSGAYPTTEQTLSSLSMLLNGGGLGQLKDINDALTTAFANGRDAELRDLLEQLNNFTTALDAQTDTIVHAAESLNSVAGQFAAQKPVLDQLLKTLPAAARVLADKRHQLVETVQKTGQLAALTNAAFGPTRDSLVRELQDLGPVLQSLADAGPAMTRSLSLLPTFPAVREKISKVYRGDYANTTIVADLTLSRLDATLLTGTRFEGKFTQWELQWGRTIGQIPSPYTAENPLVVPYHFAQGS